MNDQTEETFLDNGWEDSWPVTPRTRFVLWRALRALHFSLHFDMDAWPDLDDRSTVEEYPTSTRSQPREWWVETHKAVDRMAERMRTGAQWNPRTPAEEAALYLATRPIYTDMATDDIRERPGLRRQFDALPDHGDADFEYDEALVSLTGDADIELIFNPSLDGVEDPTNEVNEAAGIGDYRPSAWHRMFDTYQAEPDFPSSLL